MEKKMEERKNVVLQHKIPIVCPVYNNVEYTQKMVDSLLKNTNNDLFECFFVNNGSTDGTADYLKELVAKYPNNFRVLTQKENLGFGGGINKALEVIEAFKWEYVVIANNDLIFPKDWLIHLLESIESCPLPKVGMVGPLSNFAGGTQGINVTYKTLEEMEVFAAQNYQVNKDLFHEAGVVVGLLLLIKREFYDDVGKFDPIFFPGTWEENDLELRGALKGWRYIVHHGSFVHHYGSKTIGVVKESTDPRKNFVTNRKRFRDKWAGAGSPYEVLAESRYKLRGQNPDDYKRADGTYHKWVVGACRVKNGADLIGKTLERQSKFCDEIVVLIDQATTDNTEEICMKFPKVVTMEREPVHPYNEAWSRNRLLELAQARNPDWINMFDHDELCEERAVENRAELTDPVDPQIVLWIQPVVQLWNSENTQRMDGVWGNFYQGRMFRNLPGQTIENKIQVHSGSTPIVPNDRYGFSLFRIIHYGNIEAKYRKSKYDWYTKTDVNKDLNMALGGMKEYYWCMYYGNPTQEERNNFKNEWKVIPETNEWTRPPFGSFHDRDVYRHVYDETNMILVPFGEKPTLSLYMLCKDEGGYLPNVIGNLRQTVNEIIVVVDSRSKDGCDEVAEKLGAKVYFFDWCDDFSKARNFALSKCTGDWILRLDPDETAPTETVHQLQNMIRQPGVEGYVFPIKNWLENPRTTPNAKWALSETCRLFKNQYPTIHYRGFVHEELDDSFKELSVKRVSDLIAKGVPKALAEEQGKVRVTKIPFELHHGGYLRGQEFISKKFDYYYQLNQRMIDEQPNDGRAYFSSAVHLLWAKQYQKAVEHYLKAIELDPNNILAMNDLAVIYDTIMNDYVEADKWLTKAMDCMVPTTHPEHKRRIEKNLEGIRLKLMCKLTTVC